MNVSSVNASAAASVQSKIPTLVASQQEAQKEASAGVTNDGDEVGTNVNKSA
jgi:hypothetical protein